MAGLWIGWRILLVLLGLICRCHSENGTVVESNVTTEPVISPTSKPDLLVSLMKNCRPPTLKCVGNTMYDFLKDVMEDPGRYRVLNEYVQFVRNNATYVSESENEARSSSSIPGGLSSIEKVADSLRDKALGFVMTHNVHVRVPGDVFDGTVLRVAPEKLDDSGFTARFDVMPRDGVTGTPRIFFHKIKKVIGEKLMNALMAIVLVASLLGVKFMFMMPLFLGMAAAKKLILKLLLFFFPFLSHVFKLCPYYENAGITKYHHHHHQVSHLHHVPHYPEVKFPQSHGGHYEYSAPPDIGVDFYSDGPEVGNEIITGHRKKDNHPPQSIASDENQIHSWGFLGQGHGDKSRRRPAPPMNRPLTPKEIENLAVIAEKEAVLKVRLQQEHQRIATENKLLQDQIQQGLRLQEKLKQQSQIMLQQQQHHQQYPYQLQQQKRRVEPNPIAYGTNAGSAVMQGLVMGDPIAAALVGSVTRPVMGYATTAPSSQNFVRPSMITSPSLASNEIESHGSFYASQPDQVKNRQEHRLVATDAPIALEQTYDSFYSPILERIDEILGTIGFKEEPCKERLICSMYKNPAKFSPHSNFLSNQLSRDSSELQKPKSTNVAVVRFYKYVQAARDGQDKRECLRLYPTCSVNTEL